MEPGRRGPAGWRCSDAGTGVGQCGGTAVTQAPGGAGVAVLALALFAATGQLFGTSDLGMQAMFVATFVFLVRSGFED